MKDFTKLSILALAQHTTIDGTAHRPDNIPTVKHGSCSIMRCGCWLSVEDKMDKDKYRAILEENLVQSAKDLLPRFTKLHYSGSKPRT